MSQAVYNLIITAHYFWLTQALTLNTVMQNTIKAHASLACLGWCPVYPACVQQSAALWRTSAVKLVDPHRCPDSVLQPPLYTVVSPSRCTDIHTLTHNTTETHKHMLPAHPWLSIWWMVLSPLNASFLSPPPVARIQCLHSDEILG